VLIVAIGDWVFSREMCSVRCRVVSSGDVVLVVSSVECTMFSMGCFIFVMLLVSMMDLMF